MSTISLETAKRLEKQLGEWVWDGLLFNRDAITNPKLTILPNQAGTRIRNFLKETPNQKETI